MKGMAKKAWYTDPRRVLSAMNLLITVITIGVWIGSGSVKSALDFWVWYTVITYAIAGAGWWAGFLGKCEKCEKEKTND
jgi:hypothetical protein